MWRWGKHKRVAPASRRPVIGRYVLLLQVVASFSWLVPLLLLVVAGWQIWQQELRLSHARARSAFGVLAEEAGKVFEAQEMALDWIDDRIRNQSWDEIERSAELHEFLVNLDDKSNYIDSIWLFDAKGDVRATTRSYPLQRRINVADRDYFQAAEREASGIRIGIPAGGRMTGTFAFHVARRRSWHGDVFDGVMLLAFSPTSFGKQFLDMGDGEAPQVMLLRADGAVRQRPRPAARERPVHRRSLPGKGPPGVRRRPRSSKPSSAA